MMSIRRSIGRFLLMVVVCAGILMLSACQQEQSENVLIGIWSNDYTYLMYREDGSFFVAYTITDLESAPAGWGTYTFEGELVTFFDDEKA